MTVGTAGTHGSDVGAIRYSDVTMESVTCRGHDVDGDDARRPTSSPTTRRRDASFVPPISDPTVGQACRPCFQERSRRRRLRFLS